MDAYVPERCGRPAVSGLIHGATRQTSRTAAPNRTTAHNRTTAPNRTTAHNRTTAPNRTTAHNRTTATDPTTTQVSASSARSPDSVGRSANDEASSSREWMSSFW